MSEATLEVALIRGAIICTASYSIQYDTLNCGANIAAMSGDLRSDPPKISMVTDSGRQTDGQTDRYQHMASVAIEAVVSRLCCNIN